MSALLQRLREKGARGTIKALAARATRPLHLARVRGAAEYLSPTDAELMEIEARLRKLGIDVRDYVVDRRAFDAFKARFPFPSGYHGGDESGVYEEKLLEHFVAWDLLGFETQPSLPYMDVAGASSPWARLLRDQGIEAYSIDLSPHPAFANLSYYIKGDATKMPWGQGSVGSASLQCAYEMFLADSDMRLLAELSRVLKPSGRVVIVPLYMHTHACFYQSPEYFGQPIGDAGATPYVRRHARGVPASRKYSPETLLERVWKPAHAAGLTPEVRVLRNKRDLGSGIYLHFALTLEKR
jgi:SAM-dependent methyltransferase